MSSSSRGEEEEAAAGMMASESTKQQQLGIPTWLLASRQEQQQQQRSEGEMWPGAAATTSYTNWLSGRSLDAGEQQQQQQQMQQQQQQQEPPKSVLLQEGSGGVAAAELLKADIVTHPLYEQLLEAHVACLRIATPVDQLSKIDGQIAQCHHVMSKYSILANHQLLCGNSKEELDQFMAHYVMLLRSFKEQLQHHVRVHAKEAVMACWELEQSLLGLTGVSPGEGSGATMSDDEDEQQSTEPDYWQDSLGFGPLIPTETERTLMERVRQELKHELKHGYRARIVDVREEILRKRRAGKLPGDTTSVLKAWWHAHSKWPYPTEDEKARLVQETGLELKQINNWFINQRKRNWHHHPSSSTSSSKMKSKR